MRYSVNVGAVWGQMPTGGGQKSLNEIMAATNVPGMSKKNNNIYKNCSITGKYFSRGDNIG